MSVLLDGNVLIALAVAEHVHHDRVVDWFSGATDQGAYLRCRTLVRLSRLPAPRTVSVTW
jgi:predicted nucleic acid-binding protein